MNRYYNNIDWNNVWIADPMQNGNPLPNYNFALNYSDPGNQRALKGDMRNPNAFDFISGFFPFTSLWFADALINTYKTNNY